MKRRPKKQKTALRQSEKRISHSTIGPIRLVQRGRGRPTAKYKCGDCGATSKFGRWEQSLNRKTDRNHCPGCGSTFLEKAKD